jgi:hypothetical protein
MAPTSQPPDADFVRLQLDFAQAAGRQSGAKLSDVLLSHTSLHRLLGLGRADPDPAAGWLDLIDDINRAASSAEVERLVMDLLARAPTPAPDPSHTVFGCFACETPAADGGVRIHFTHRDPRPGPGPLSSVRMEVRRAELDAMVNYLVSSEPKALTISGASWLYNTEAYRRLFPTAYVSSLKPKSGPRTMSGYSHWGQFIDHEGRLKAEMAARFRSGFELIRPDAPWLAFPLQILVASAPIAAFTGVN